MKDEIKEILDDLLFTTTLPNASVKLNKEKLNQLKNYITNLQQENQDIKDTLQDKLDYIGHLKELCDKYEEEHNTEFKIWKDERCQLLDYKSRNEKAIEYIMTDLITEWDIKNDGYVSGSDLPVDAITPLLNILNIDDENKVNCYRATNLECDLAFKINEIIDYLKSKGE